MKIQGSTILITGASSGIGAAAARLLAERGATVGIVARREDRLRQVLDDCRAHAPESRLWVADLADVEGAERLVLEVWDTLGGLDVIVHNAGIPKRRRAQELTADEIELTMRTNYLSPVRMTLAVLPRMLERGGGTIVNVSSLAGRLGVASEAAYCGSKAALCGWSEGLAIDLAGTGVDVRLVLPGAIDTEIWDLPDNDPPFYTGPKEPPAVVAEAIASAIEGDRFEIYSPDMAGIVEWKTANIDEYLGTVAGMRETGVGEVDLT